MIVLVIGITATLGLMALGLRVFVLDPSPPLRPAATRRAEPFLHASHDQRSKIVCSVQARRRDP